MRNTAVGHRNRTPLRIPYAHGASSTSRRNGIRLQIAAPHKGISMLDIILLAGAFGAFGLLGLYVHGCGRI
jgi:hypothetical protein